MEATPLTTEQQDIATKLQALSFGKQAEQEQVILAYARNAVPSYNVAAQKWNGRKQTFTFRVNTAPTSLYHNDKCKSKKVAF